MPPLARRWRPGCFGCPPSLVFGFSSCVSSCQAAFAFWFFSLLLRCGLTRSARCARAGRSAPCTRCSGTVPAAPRRCVPPAVPPDDAPRTGTVWECPTLAVRTIDCHCFPHRAQGVVCSVRASSQRQREGNTGNVPGLGAIAIGPPQQETQQGTGPGRLLLKKT